MPFIAVYAKEGNGVPLRLYRLERTSFAATWNLSIAQIEKRRIRFAPIPVAQPLRAPSPRYLEREAPRRT